MTLPVLGVDPGANGGAYLLGGDGRSCLAWWAWATLTRKAGKVLRMRTCTAFEGSIVVYVDDVPDGMAQVGRALAGQAFVSVVEELFVPRPKRGRVPTNPQSVIPLAEDAGRILGALEVGGATVLRVPARVWRFQVLSLPHRTPAKQAEEAAVRLVRAGGPVDPPPALDGVPQGECGAVCEAACIARWGWVQTREGR